MRFCTHRNPKASLPLKGGAFVTKVRDKPARELMRGNSPIGVIGAVAAFRRHPSNVLRGVFYVTGFAMYAVLRVDLKPDFVALADHFIDLRRAVSLRRLGIFRQVLGDR